MKIQKHVTLWSDEPVAISSSSHQISFLHSFHHNILCSSIIITTFHHQRYFFNRNWFQLSGHPNGSCTFLIWVSLTWLFCEYDEPKVQILKHKLEPLGITLDNNSCLSGMYHNLYCPKVSTSLFSMYLVFMWVLFCFVS